VCFEIISNLNYGSIGNKEKAGAHFLHIFRTLFYFSRTVIKGVTHVGTKDNKVKKQRMSRSYDNFDEPEGVIDDVDAVYVTPAARSPSKRASAASPKRSPASGSKTASAKASSSKTASTKASGSKSPRRTSVEAINTSYGMPGSEQVYQIPDIFSQGFDSADSLKASPSRGTAAKIAVGTASVVVGATTASVSAGMAESAASANTSPLIDAVSSQTKSRGVIPSLISAGARSLSPNASRAVSAGVEAASEIARLPTSGAPLGSVRLSDVPVPGLSKSISHTPLAAASLTGAVKPSTQVSASPVSAIIAGELKESALSRTAAAISGAVSPRGASPASMTPEVKALAESLAIAQPTRRVPSPMRSKSASPALSKVPVLSATEILESMGMVPLRVLVTREDDGSENTARYILATTDIHNGHFSSCISAKEMAKRSGSSLPCMPLTFLVALDTDAPVSTEEKILDAIGYSPKKETITVIEKHPSASRSLTTPREVRLLVATPPGISGVCSLSRDLSVVRTAVRGGSLRVSSPFTSPATDAGKIEFGELVVVQDGEREGARSAVELADESVMLGSAGVAPIVSLSALITSPQKTAKELVQTTAIIKKRAIETDEEFMRAHTHLLRKRKEEIVQRACTNFSKIEEWIVSYQRMLAETEARVDKTLCVLNGYLRVYDQMRENSANGLIPDSEEDKLSRVLSNIEKFAKIRVDLQNITASFMRGVQMYTQMQTSVLDIMVNAMDTVEPHLTGVYSLLAANHSVSDWDLTSTGADM